MVEVFLVPFLVLVDQVPSGFLIHRINILCNMRLGGVKLVVMGLIARFWMSIRPATVFFRITLHASFCLMHLFLLDRFGQLFYC